MMSHARRVRQLIGAMKMCPYYSWIALIGTLAAMPIGIAEENETLVDSLRPKTIYLEDFESYELGTSEIGGEFLRSGGGPDTSIIKVADSAADKALSSKQLTVSEGILAWSTDWIEVPKPLLTSVSLDVTALSTEEAFDNHNVVLVHATLSNGETVTKFPINIRGDDLPLTDGQTTVRGKLPLGALVEGGSLDETTLKLTITALTDKPGNYFAFDNLQLTEETTNVPIDQLAPPELLDDPRFSQVFYPILKTGFIRSIDSVSDEQSPYLDFTVEYENSAFEIDLTSLGDDDVCVGSSNQNLAERPLPVEFIDYEEGLDGHVVANYRLHRPADGWKSLPLSPSLFLCDGGLRRIDGQTNAGRWAASFYTRPPAEIRFGGEHAPPIEGDEPWIDLTATIQSNAPYPTSNLEKITVFAHAGAERILATFQGVTGVSDDGHQLTVAYRLERPSYGWPSFPMLLTSESDNVDRLATIYEGDTNVIRVTPGRSFVKIIVPEASETPPGMRPGTSSHAQFVLAGDETFSVNVNYVSNIAIDATTIGDGDVVLHGEHAQPGKLVSVELSNEGKLAQATFEFQRDPLAFKGQFEFPNGSVSNVDGESYRGYLETPRGSVRLWQEDAQVVSGFLPLSKLSSALTTYRFRVIYQSDQAPIRLDDLDRPHIIMVPLSVDPAQKVQHAEAFPEITGRHVRDDGHSVQVDYLLDQPANGWPKAFQLELVQAAIRNTAGGTHWDSDLAIVGPKGGDTLTTQLIGGRLIDGDPETHRMSFLINAPNYVSLRSGHGAHLWMGWHPEIMGVLEEGDQEPPVVGRLVDVSPIGQGWQNAVISFDIDRPQNGWDSWNLASVPYALQAPGLNGIADSLIDSGYVSLGDCEDPLPLLFSFEDWARRLEQQAELPEGTLEGDTDGDGQDGLTEFALGSDATDTNKTASIEPKVVTKDDQRHVELKFPVRSNSFGLSAELQHSFDGREWRTAEKQFELIERQEIAEGVDEVKLRAKDPLAKGQPVGLFRIAIVR